MYVVEEKRAGHLGTGKKYEHLFTAVSRDYIMQNCQCLLVNEYFYHPMIS